MKQIAACALIALVLSGCKELTSSEPGDLDSPDPHVTDGTSRPTHSCAEAAGHASRAASRYRRASWRVRWSGQKGVDAAVVAFGELMSAHNGMTTECSGEQGYTVGGTVAGLSGSNSLTLQNNGADDITLTTDGQFTFATTLTEGSGYAVTIVASPADQACSVLNASGSIAGANVSDVQVECVDTTTGSSVPTIPGDLVVSEFISNPAAVTDAAGEWFEIYNPTATAFELMGLVVRDDGSNVFTVGESLIIQPGAYLVFGTNADQAANGGAPVDYSYGGFTLANASDEIELVMGEIVIDRVAYGAGFPLVAGQATSLDAGGLDAVSNDTGANWCSAQIVMSGGDLGSPGVSNGACQ